MKKNLVKFAVLGIFVFASCTKGFDAIEPEPTPTPDPTPNPTLQEEINANVEKVFGVTFDKNHDWNSTVSGSVTINVNSSDVEKVQLLAYTEADVLNEFNEKETSMTVLNETDINGQTSVTLYYDAPKNNLGLYAAFITKNDFILQKVEGNSASYSKSAKTRAISTEYTLPTGELKIGESIPSYANERGWIEGQMLYGLDDYSTQKMEVANYDNEFKTIFNNYAFSFFKNGRSYNNLPLVEGTGMYNETGYPLTTGDEPILISPIYKRDGGSQYGDEVLNSDLYYYYFKESDLAGKDPVEYLNSLPKYKAFPFATEYSGLTENSTLKKYAYALIYWGDGIPNENTTGTYQFPAGYKIGFMVRAKTTHKEGNPNKARKQGELYGDGRLNNNINTYSECNFKSSELGEDGPRMAWLRINGKQLICFESGTDKDFNDIFLEIEGGINDMFYTPNLTANTYTYCFEDRDLGDYDLNDVVIKATRSGNKVTYSIVACGAKDELYVKNINDKKIKDKEIHKLFGKTREDFINTDESLDKCAYITATIDVSENFSFLDDNTRPYIYNKTTGKNIYVAKAGEDPHGIMIPNDFKYPKERTCIKATYEKFNSWGQNPITAIEWYTNPAEGRYYNK